MKKLSLMLILLILSISVFAQWNVNASSITTTSNVGIGTTLAPTAKLEISAIGDGVNILKLSTERPWVFQQQGTGASANLVLKDLNGGKYFKISNYDGSDVFTLETSLGTGYFKGRLGIGTQTPYVKSGLHVKSTSVSPWGILSEAASNDGIIAMGHTGNYGVIAVSYLGNLGHKPLQFWTSNIARMTINTNGNVGIGTDEPGNFKLAVEGKIGAREVNVTTASPWPDYVFGNEYSLPSLLDLEYYINTNKHLPDVPTARDVEKDGVNVGEMNLILLKKIEELTLYMIELKKENEVIKQQLNKLQNE